MCGRRGLLRDAGPPHHEGWVLPIHIGWQRADRVEALIEEGKLVVENLQTAHSN
jgi:hypothetical protein